MKNGIDWNDAAERGDLGRGIGPVIVYGHARYSEADDGWVVEDATGKRYALQGQMVWPSREALEEAARGPFSPDVVSKKPERITV